MGSNQMPCMFEVIYEIWAAYACNVIASSERDHFSMDNSVCGLLEGTMFYIM